jgi:hypothetical protein
MAPWKILTVLGLVLNGVGVVLLFLYTLPRRQRTKGILFNWTTTVPDQGLVKLERNWDVLSTIGLWCVIIGIVLQGLGVWMSP